MRLLLYPLLGGKGLGIITRSLAIAEEAILRGHVVGVICTRSLEGVYKSLGVTTFTIEPPPISLDLPSRIADFNSFLASHGYGSLSTFERIVSSENIVIDTFKPDLIFSEFQPTVRISSAMHSIPLASIATWPFHPEFNADESNINNNIVECANQILENNDQSRIEHMGELGFLRSELLIAPLSSKLEPDLNKYSKDVLFVGSLLSSSLELGEISYDLLRWIDRQDVIFIYLSSGSINAGNSIVAIEKFSKVINKRYGAKIVFAVGRDYLGKHPNLLKLPSPTNSLYVVETVPGMSFLAHVNFVITRGGPNSIVASLLANCPMIVIPGEHSEPIYFGNIIESTYLGMKYKAKSINDVELVQIFKSVIESDKIRQSVDNMADNLRDLGGKLATLSAMEKLITG